MTRISSQLLVPPGIRPRSGRHYNRYGEALVTFKRAVDREFLTEIDRMCRSFVHGPLSVQAAPVLTALREYLAWLGWCAWCSCHLAPPLNLVGGQDVKRMAAAVLVYCGPRLIDDAIDDHRSYKGKQETLLGRLIAAFPDLPAASIRCQAGLLGSWLIFYGLQRLERHGLPQAARRTMRLCERIAPGAVLEDLHAGPLSWEQYSQIVALKAVHYDEILYRNLLDPVQQPLKGRLLRLAARLSRIAQYLNWRKLNPPEAHFDFHSWLVERRTDELFCAVGANVLLTSLGGIEYARGGALDGDKGYCSLIASLGAELEALLDERRDRVKWRCSDTRG